MLTVPVLPLYLMLQMSSAPEPQSPEWRGSERIALLTTVLQDLDPDLATTLLHLILQRGGQPRWHDIALPEGKLFCATNDPQRSRRPLHNPGAALATREIALLTTEIGRSLNACKSVFEEMRRRSSTSSIGYGSYPVAPPTMYPAQPQLNQMMPRKRSYNEQETQMQAQRVLQPKPARSIDSPVPPPVTNGESFTFTRVPSQDLGAKPPPKKRGRPNKNEMDRRRQEAEARGEVYPDPKRRRARQSEVKTESSPLPTSASQEPPQRAVAVETPQRQTPESLERSSSGKRRRQKQREKDEDSLMRDAGSPSRSMGQKAAQSPSDRLLMKEASTGRSTAMSATARDVFSSEPIGGPSPREHSQDLSTAEPKEGDNMSG